MEIYYHDCNFSDFDVNGSGEEETRSFDCSHPDKKDNRECFLNNYLTGTTGNCNLAHKKWETIGDATPRH